MTREKPIELRMEIITNIPTAMRDGITLYGNLYKAEGNKKCPTILFRYIFKKERAGRNWKIYNPEFYVKAGYNVFVQDVRGTGVSEGEFERFTADGKDGYDTIEWLATQPWCDGNVGMFGNFYAGFLQFAAAAERPPHLKAICPFQTSVVLNRDNNNRGFLFSSHIGWCLSRILERVKEGWYDEELANRLIPQMEVYVANYQKQVLYRPLRDMPAAKFDEFPIFKDYIDHLVVNYDNPDYIHKEGKDMDFSRINVPAFGCAGWFDVSRNSTIDQYLGLIKDGEGLAKESEMLIGPWIPGEAMSTEGIELSFGENSTEEYIGVVQRMIAWFDRWLKGITPAQKKDPIEFFVVGKNIWRSEKEWPLTNTVDKIYYLQSAGRANTCLGNGKLSPNKASVNQKVDSFIYDPNNLVPSLSIGKDASELEKRGDILVYTSEEFTQDTEFSGLASAILYVSSSAVDTDFMVRIMDVLPNGKAVAISDGATRARYRNSWEPELLEHGKVYEVEVKIGYISYTYQKGHKIRIDITSSNFMKFDYNHNTGLRPADDPNIVVAVNTIHHNEIYDSRLILPLIP